MSTIYDLTTKIDGKGIHLFQYGYMEAKEAALLEYDMYDLNKEGLDFRTATLKKSAQKVSITETGDAIAWYEEDLKEADVTIQTVNSATEIVLTAAGPVVGEMLFNPVTWTTVVVVGVSSATLTLKSPGDTAWVAGQTLKRANFAKKYGADHSFSAARNDLTTKTNYIQWTETLISSDSIANNKTRLFVGSPEEYLKRQFTDGSRKMIKGMVNSFYFGVSSKTLVGSNYIYTAWGLEEYIPSGAKVNIQGSDDEETKANLRKQIRYAYQSGLADIRGNNKLLAFCTTAFADAIDALYESKVVYNDKLNAVDIEIKSYSVGGNRLNLVVSNVLDTNFGDTNVCYLVPVDYTFLYNLPKYAANEDGKTLQSAGRGIVYKKPQSTYETSSIALGTSYSFMFGGVTSGAYRKLTIA